MVWTGCHDLTVLEVDEDGYLVSEFIIGPNGQIPPFAMKLLRIAQEVDEVEEGGFLAIVYSKNKVIGVGRGKLDKDTERDSFNRKKYKRDLH